MMVKETPEMIRYKVLAGIVMTTSLDYFSSAHVVSVAAGNKVVNGGRLCLNGEALNDCHAEILARRALLSFLYDQLAAHTAHPTGGSIFEPSNEPQDRLKLKANVRFHLYISSAPCGDARIFNLNGSLTDPSRDLYPIRPGRGMLRTKIEAGEGLFVRPFNREKHF